MLKNYFKTSIRNISRQKVYSFINILGLAIGIGLFTIIAFYIRDELSYDKFHQKIDRIYKLERGELAISNAKTGEFLREKFPEIEHVNRFGRRSINITYNNDNFKISNSVFADSCVFNMFTFPLKQGDPNNVLTDKYSIVLTESTAKKIFGEENPVGKIIKVGKDLNYTIKGVAKDLPKNSSINANAFVNFESIHHYYDAPKEKVWNHYNNYFIYVLLNKGVDHEKFEKKLNKVTREYLLAENSIESAEEYKERTRNLRPFSEVYFTQGVKFDYFNEHGKKEFVYIFIAVGLFVLIIACVNFVNLSTARSSLRGKEIGIRKVLGSDKKKIMFGYLAEAILISFFATILGLGIAELLTPVFNKIILANVTINYTVQFIIIALTGGILLGILAGIYPSMVLSSKPLLSTIKGEEAAGRKGKNFRSILTVFQYTISVILIIATLVVFKQLHYVKTKDLGLNQEKVLYFFANTNKSKKKVLKEKLLQNPNIKSVAFANNIPGRVMMNQGFNTGDQSLNINSLPIDENFIDLFDIEIIRGRNFISNSKKDQETAYIINESAAKIINNENVIDSPLKVWDNKKMGKIVGVVKDFHFKSLHHNIGPLVMYYRPDWSHVFFTKINGNQINKTVDFIKKTGNEVIEDFAFTHGFVDESYNRTYHKEQRYGKLFGYFAIIAIFIASLGLFGLALFSTSQRMKEISIRKVFGSRSKQVILLLVKDFSKWVIIANLIGWPVAYLFMQKWLQNFAYKTSISWIVFLTALIITLLIALVTVIFQASHAANTNPADVLRDE